MSRASNSENRHIFESHHKNQPKLGLKEAIWRLLWEGNQPYTVKDISRQLYMGEATANSLLHLLMKEKKIQRHKVTSTISGRKTSRYVYYGIEPYIDSQHEELSPLMAQVYQLFVSTGQKYSAERVSALLNLAPTSTATVLYRLYKQGYLSRNKEYSGTRRRYLYVLEENADRESSYIIEKMDQLPNKGGTLKDLSAATGMSIRTLKEVMLDLFKEGRVCRRRHGDYIENESLVYFLRHDKAMRYHIHRLLEYKVVQELEKCGGWLSLGELEERLGVNLSRIRKVIQSMYDSFIVDRINLSGETVQRRGYGYSLTKVGKERTIDTWDYFDEIISIEQQMAKRS